MRKRILSIMLSLCLITGAVAGCGKSDDVPVSGTAEESSAERDQADDESGEPGQSLSESTEATPEPTSEATPEPTSEPTPEPIPEPTKESYVQQGTQLDGGEYCGLNWVFTDANELILSGNLQDGPHVWYDYAQQTGVAPWWEYQEDVKIASLSFSATGSMAFFFAGYQSLEKVDLTGLDTSNVTEMQCMFYDCRYLKSLDLSGLDTGNVTNMNSIFYGCEGLISLDLSGFDTSNVTNMNGMFSYCEDLKEILVSDGWVLAPECDGMFTECKVQQVTYK